METSIRYSADLKALRIHAKEKLPIDSNTHLQLHGELDTRLGAPTFLSAVIRHFHPDLSASLGVGLQHTREDKLHYSIRAKKAFPVTTNGFFKFHIKGQCDVDQEFRRKKSKGAAEFSWIIFNFKKDQDVRLKVGYEVCNKDWMIKKPPQVLNVEIIVPSTTKWEKTDHFFMHDMKKECYIDKVECLDECLEIITNLDEKMKQTQVPYMQIRENNWTINADINGRWNLRYDL